MKKYAAYYRTVEMAELKSVIARLSTQTERTEQDNGRLAAAQQELSRRQRAWR